MSSFGEKLIAASAHQPDAAAIDLFGRLVGDWDVDNSLFSESSGEWSASVLRWTFALILDGRGVQDVIVDGSGASVGTTVRTWDRVAGWRIVWFSPRSPEHCVLHVVDDSPGTIRLRGVQSDGRQIRWEFSSIDHQSFMWDGWCSNDDGVTWWHEQHMAARRASP